MKTVFSSVAVYLMLLLSCTASKDGETNTKPDSVTSVQLQATPLESDEVAYPGDYPHLSSEKLTEQSMEEINPLDIRIMRNEIFARHGYIFKSDDLREHFSSKSWYKPQFANVDDMLTEIEKYNITLLAEKEKRNRNSPIAQVIRKLPFVKLPLISYGSFGFTELDSVIVLDGDKECDKVRLYGLLPDTTRIFAVLWSGGVKATIDYDYTIYVTTFDKHVNVIETAQVKLTDLEMMPMNGCTKIDQESEASTIDREWRYSSDYRVEVSCATSGDDLKSTYHVLISGQIMKNGTIQENEVYE